MMQHDYSALFSTAYTFIGWLLMFVIVWFVTRSKGINLSNSIVHAGPRLKTISKIARSLSSDLSRDGSPSEAAMKRRLRRILKYQRSVVRILDLYLFENPSDTEVKEIRAMVTEIGSRASCDDFSKTQIRDASVEIERICLGAQVSLEGTVSKYRK